MSACPNNQRQPVVVAEKLALPLQFNIARPGKNHLSAQHLSFKNMDSVFLRWNTAPFWLNCVQLFWTIEVASNQKWKHPATVDETGHTENEFIVNTAGGCLLAYITFVSLRSLKDHIFNILKSICVTTGWIERSPLLFFCFFAQIIVFPQQTQSTSKFFHTPEKTKKENEPINNTNLCLIVLNSGAKPAFSRA